MMKSSSHEALTPATSNTIKVDVDTVYIESESAPAENRYVFAYTVTIRNLGPRPAKLLSRHWRIIDENGKIEEVVGDGVVGEQPLLKPGEGFQYSSGTTLETPLGTMGGRYTLIDPQGHAFKAEIPEFLLSTPRVLH